MRYLKKLLQILGKWKSYYILSAVLLIISIFIRMLQPKILQITVDKVIVYFQSGGKINIIPEDSITKFLYSILPELKMDNLSIILISLSGIFIVISLLRGLFAFSSTAITASSTEKAIKELRDRLFSHIQAVLNIKIL